MKPASLTFLLILSACGALQAQQTLKAGQKLTFSITANFQNSPKMAHQMAGSFGQIDSVSAPDSSVQKLTKVLEKKMADAAKYPSELYIGITEDGWTYQKFISNKYTYLYRYFFRNDSVQVFDISKTERINSAKLNQSPCDYNIKINKRKKKTILGYQCYYVKVTENISNAAAQKVMGQMVYEMYVTGKIALPSEALLKNDCKMPGFFPLEVTKYPSKSPENNTHYKLVRIE